MITALTGNNHFLLSRRLEELAGRFTAQYGDLAVEKIDVGESDLATILDALQAAPFLSPKKLVVVKNLSANKLAAEAIEQIISSTGDLADLIIYDPAPDKRTAYFKVLKSQTELEEFNDLDGPALAKWLVGEAKKQGGELSLADANHLVDKVGADQELLSNELDKLLTYDPKVTRADIDLLSVETPHSKVFDLLDASFAGNKKRALKLYDEQRAQKVEAQAIMAMIAWQLRLLAIAKTAPAKTTPSQIAKDSSVSPYPIIKAQKLAGRISEEQLRAMVAEALEIDELGKTKSINLDEAIRAYILAL